MVRQASQQEGDQVWEYHDDGHPSGSESARNPTITEIEPVNVMVWADHDSGGVGIEIADQDGNGFMTLLDWAPALDAAMRIAAACAKLRGIGT
jgi:hypothetical protein